ncbi:MAG: hypothetical protein MUC39_01580 [Candidatus Omnitrophica bacterium]|jgi:hypothetical protein|nr:hypothetical protein [Candidatus Omnitrophota bacterium]
MAEKEFPKINLEEPLPESAGGSGLKPKISEFTRKLLVFIKFVLGVCLLPCVYAVSAAFLKQFGLIDISIQDYFWQGVITLLIIYLFIWEPVIVYTKGQKIVELLFTFFKPLVRVAPYLLPIYTILLVAVYGVLSWVYKDLLGYFVFMFGFTLALHLIFSAKTLRSKKEDFFKTNYIFGFSLVFIINLTLLAFFINLMFDKFSFVGFCNDVVRVSRGIFEAVFTQLFINK